MNSTNESLNSQHGISADILSEAGEELRQALNHEDACKTGHAVCTKGFALPAKHILHTVGPRYNAKYETAAANALHNCYRNTLHLAREIGARNVALTVVHSQRKGYPPELGAHIACRTVRRFLEHYPDAFDTIIFSMIEGEVNFGVYKNILPLYFPRDDEEFEKARKLLPEDCGDEWGEKQIEERKIRIDTKIVKSDVGKAEQQQSDRAKILFGNESTMIDDAELRPTALATMTPSSDAARQKAVRAKLAATSIPNERIVQYQQWRNAAAASDLSDIARLGFAYRAGPDQHGREILVLLGARLPVAQVDMQRVFLYVVDMLASMSATTHEFSLVYVHGGVTAANDVPMSWWKQLYGVLDWPHGDKLRSVYIVHPTFMLKVGFTLMSPFLSSQFNDKVEYVKNLNHLFQIFTKETLQLPNYVFEFDKKL